MELLYVYCAAVDDDDDYDESGMFPMRRSALGVPEGSDEGADPGAGSARGEADVDTKGEKSELATAKKNGPSLREVGRYSIWVLLFTLICLLSRPSEETIYVRDRLKEKVEGSEIQDLKFHKLFPDLVDFNDAWAWLMGPLYEAVWTSHLPGDVGLPTGEILNGNFVLNSVRLRQIRVKSSNCEYPPPGLSSVQNGACYPSLSEGTADVNSYSPGWFPGGGANASACQGILACSGVLDGSTTGFVYNGNLASELGSGHWGKLGSYDGNGYIQDLSLDANRSRCILECLKENDWLDRQTRVVFVDIVTYNPNLRYFLAGRWLLEAPAGGGIITSSTLELARLFRYSSPLETFVMVCEIVFLAMLLWYIVEEVSEIRRQRMQYLKNGWNLMDWINIVLFLVAVFNRATVLMQVNSLPVLLNADGSYLDLHNAISLATLEQYVLAVNGFFLYFKFFKFFGETPSMNHMMRTLGKASNDLLLFMVMFFIVYMGFTVAFYLSFSASLPGFRTIGLTFFSQFGILLGDVIFEELYESNRILGPLLFFSFVVFMLFMLLNMFLAIINDAFIKVKEEDKKSGKKGMGDAIGGALEFAWQKFAKRREKVKSFASQIARKGDDVVTVEEIESVLSNNREAAGLLGFKTAADVLARYDTDGNGVLDPEELEDLQAEMNDILANKLGEDAAARNAQAMVYGRGGMEEQSLIQHKKGSDVSSRQMQELVKKVVVVEELRAMTMGISDKLNALTEYLLSAPTQATGGPGDRQLKTINKKLDLLSEALVSQAVDPGASTTGMMPGTASSSMHLTSSMNTPAMSMSESTRLDGSQRMEASSFPRDVYGWTEST